jgi:hypothetical protein
MPFVGCKDHARIGNSCLQTGVPLSRCEGQGLRSPVCLPFVEGDRGGSHGRLSSMQSLQIVGDCVEMGSPCGREIQQPGAPYGAGRSRAPGSDPVPSSRRASECADDTNLHHRPIPDSVILWWWHRWYRVASRFPTRCRHLSEESLPIPLRVEYRFVHEVVGCESRESYTPSSP